jgi:hypothetical protein
MCDVSRCLRSLTLCRMLHRGLAVCLVQQSIFAGLTSSILAGVFLLTTVRVVIGLVAEVVEGVGREVRAGCGVVRLERLVARERGCRNYHIDVGRFV